MFLQGTGDVLLSYENEAINVERQGDPVEHVTPPQTFKIENPVAVVTSPARICDKAKALKDFLYTAEGQKLWAEAGFRPVDPTVAADFADDFPTPEKLWTIDDLGGWSERRPRAVREGHWQHRRDLQAGHWMTAALNAEATPPELTDRGGNGGAPGRFSGRYGTTSLRVGAASMWLSIIVLLPLAASCGSRQAAGGRRSGMRSPPTRLSSRSG